MSPEVPLYPLYENIGLMLPHFNSAEKALILLLEGEPFVNYN
jgi:hypothetical protein